MGNPSPAAPATLNPDDFEIVLPEGMTVEGISATLTAPVHVPDDEVALDEAAGGGSRRAVVPEPPVAPVPAAAPARPAVAAPPGVIAERRKRQEAEARTAKLEAELAQAEVATRLARQQQDEERTRRANTPVQIQVTDAEWATARRVAENAPDAAGQFEAGAKFILDRVNGALRENTARVAPVVTAKRSVQEMDTEMREKTPDYDQVLTSAGILGRLQKDANGQVVDPGLQTLIYSSENPAVKAYEIGQRILAKRAAAAAPAGEELADEPEVPAAPAAPAAVQRNGTNGAPVAPTADAIAAAERRGREEALAAVTDTSVLRGRGIRSVPNAGGPPKAVLNKASLDELSKRNPDAFMKIIETNPALEFEYYS